MSRTVILPTPADPYVCMLWMKMYENFKDEIDHLYVSINSSIDHTVARFIQQRFEQDPKTTVIYTDHLTQHGTEMARLTRLTNDDLIMFIEDDGYIIQPKIVDRFFSMIEKDECDVVGSPRTSSSMDIQRVASKKFNVDLSKFGDAGVSLWPNFLFVRRNDLLRTDMDFNARAWMKGDYIEELDWIVDPDNGVDVRGDTFVWGSLQLRALGLRVLEVPQYHLHPYWKSELREHVNVFDHHCPWVHVGSLSGSIYGILTDDRGVPLAYKESNYSVPGEGWRLPVNANTEAEKLEHQKRCAFQLMAYRLFSTPEIEDFGNQYFTAINRVIDQGGLDRTDIEDQILAYRNLMKI